MPIASGGRFSPDQNIVSPGVFTRQIDQSGVAQGVADIGGAIVAPFAKGPGFHPTLCKSLAQLQSTFGVADGTLYGPYTAQQYLAQKGFVTVCRVGAITGYEQKYPWVIWAQSGMWDRAVESASFTQASSISQTAPVYSGSTLLYGIVWNTATQAQSGLTASFTGSVLIKNQPSTMVVSGSSYYNGSTVNGLINGTFPWTGSITNYSTSSATSASILSNIFAKGGFVGSLTGVGAVFTSGQSPFDTTIISANVLSVSQSLDLCNNVSLVGYGNLTAQMGSYSGNFTGGSYTFNPCTNQWTSVGSPQYLVLGALANTQFSPIGTNLQEPGFLGSTQLYNPPVSGSSNVGLEVDLNLSQSLGAGYGTYHFSIDASNAKYITNVFGKDATAGNPEHYVAGTKVEAAYLYSIFEDAMSIVAANPSGWKIMGNTMPSGSWSGEPLNFTDAYSLAPTTGDSAYALTNASTPWVISQAVSAWNGGSPTRFPLFQLFTIGDGTYANTSYKIQISNVKLAGTVPGSDWGTFSLTVRQYGDTDKKPIILEQFNGLTLDPSSPNFIARAIGDQYSYIRFDGKIITYGLYQNNSKYIYVQMSQNNYPTTAVPYGFQAMTTPIAGAMGTHCPTMAYSKASVYGLFPGKYPSGVDFTGAPAGADSELTALYPTSSMGNGCFSDNLQYFAPVPVGASVGNNQIFALDINYSGSGVGVGSFISGSNSVPSTYDAVNESTYVKMRNFVFGFQGGFDGQSPAIELLTGMNISAGNTQGLNCANSTTAGSIAYQQCIAALGNADEFDINLIVTPGIIYSLHPYVVTLTTEMCERRGDCFYIMDLYLDGGNPATGQIDEVVSMAGEFDTSYVATYYPWVNIKDTNTNQIVTVPPSVVMPAIYANNDNVAGEWWAAAGLNRGGIPIASSVTDRTIQTERDTLYEGKVNPIAAFPGTGVAVWGQKTLQNKNSALSRINVQRLLINIKKFFASTAKYIVFEQNTAATRNKFLAIVNPYLESIQQRSGLYAFQVVMDDSNNTADLIDQNVLYGQIYIQPTRTAEFILLDFNVMPTGAAFPTA